MTRRHSPTIGLLGLIILLASAPTMAAAESAPGSSNSQIDQYIEGVPNPGGDQPTQTSDAGGDGSGSSPGSGPGGYGDSVLSPSAATSLDRLGAEGRAAARLADASAPDVGNRGAALSDDQENGRSGIGAVVSALTGSDGSGDGLGVALPLLLIATAAGAVAYSIVRRRADPSG